MYPENTNSLPKGQQRRYLSFLFLLLFCGLAFAQTAANKLDLIIMTFPEPGWYMVSVPLELTDNTVSSLFPTATSAFAWDKDHYVPTDTIGISQGIWLFIPDSSIAIISGDAITEFSGHFTPGWQMIGSVIDTVNFSDPQDTPDNSILLPAFYWNGFQSRYHPPITTFEQTFGQWIAVLQECDLLVKSASMIPIANAMDGLQTEELYVRFSRGLPFSHFRHEIEAALKLPRRSISIINLRPARLAQYPPSGWFLSGNHTNGKIDQTFDSIRPDDRSQAQWTIPMTVALKAQPGQDVVSLGLKTGATDGLDSKIDLLNPPAPPTVFDAFLQISHTIFPTLTNDFRSDSTIATTWDLIITTTNGDSGNISWDVSEFPIIDLPRSRLEIRRGNTALANMLTTNSLSFTGDQNLKIVLFQIGDTLECQTTILSPKEGDFICGASVDVTGFTQIIGGEKPFTISCEVNGIAASVTDTTFKATVPLSAGGNVLVATCTVVDNRGEKTVCSDTIRVQSMIDEIAPTCSFQRESPTVVAGTLFDNESGIAQIEPLLLLNVKLTVDPFQPGDKQVNFRVDAIDPEESMGFDIKITDRCGNTHICDPVALQLTADRANRPYVFTFRSVDRYFHLTNKGLREIRVQINGKPFSLLTERRGGAVQSLGVYAMPREGEVTIDLQPYLRRDGDNDIRIEVSGPAGGSADLLLIDDIDEAESPLVLQQLPVEYDLSQNYPNPFWSEATSRFAGNPETVIRFRIPARINVETPAAALGVQLRIYNMLGELVRTLVDQTMLPGGYTVRWNGRNDHGAPVAAGVYLYRLIAGDYSATKRLLLLK